MDASIYTLEEFKEAMRDEFRILSKEDEQLLTREQAAEFLSISLPTLNDWTKSGKLKCYRIPNTVRVYYLKSDLINSLVECSTSSK